jgi:hypothetical protein
MSALNPERLTEKSSKGRDKLPEIQHLEISKVLGQFMKEWSNLKLNKLI